MYKTNIEQMFDLSISKIGRGCAHKIASMTENNATTEIAIEILKFNVE